MATTTTDKDRPVSDRILLFVGGDYYPSRPPGDYRGEYVDAEAAKARCVGIGDESLAGMCDWARVVALTPDGKMNVLWIGNSLWGTEWEWAEGPDQWELPR